jgi:uracil phosphoribosyltransferase
MKVSVSNHPLVRHKVGILRDKRTPSPQFRSLVSELMCLLAYEATLDLSLEEGTVETPVAMAKTQKLSKPYPLIVPILRAGLGMLDGIQQVLPTAEVGFLGIRRNEKTLIPETYANRLPDQLQGRTVIIIDPMLATGGTLIDSINYVFERGADSVTAVCLIGAPEGLAAVRQQFEGKPVHLVLGILDEKLNEFGYIVPGLGDAGDRIYGLAD